MSIEEDQICGQTRFWVESECFGWRPCYNKHGCYFDHCKLSL